MPEVIRGFVLRSVLLGLLALGAVLAIDYQRFRLAPLQLSDEQVINVAAGLSQQALIESWLEQGWIKASRDALWLRLVQKLQGGADTIKLGEYQMRPGQSLLTALKRIQQGDMLMHSFTIIEGWSVAELRQALARDERLLPTTADWPGEQLMQALDKAGQHPEGQFLPETYAFIRGSDDLFILRQASRAMDRVVQAAWQTKQAGLPLETPYQALILASIIEKETAVADERALIAGVFINRLRKGMRLQTDPTVIYGLGDQFDGNLRRRDLRADTPYNTYTRSGLPPSPIALPGAAAIQASVQPQATDKLYFVATGQGGEHYFSSNLKEHEAAVRRYQLGQ